MTKFSKRDVGFEHPAKGSDHCGQCIHYLPGHYCEIVAGTILPEDWCRKFSHMAYSHTFGAPAVQKSPAEMARGRKPSPCCTGETKEHDKVKSRITGKEYEISLGPNPDGLVPSNPFASLAQEHYLHAHPEKLGADKLAEFDAETKGKKLPKRVKKH